MRYLWEALIEAKEEQIPQQALRFVHAKNGSAYMELSLECLNQTWLREQELKEIVVEVNTYYRFYEIFKNLYAPEQSEFYDLRESLANLILHMIAQNDVCSGMTREDYHKRMFAVEILEGNFGETAREVYLLLNSMQRDRLLSGWLNSFRVGNALPIFLDMVHGLVDDSIVYYNNDLIDEIYIYTRQKKEKNLEQRIMFLVDTFLDFKYNVEIFYEYHFGIIEVEETMHIDEIAIC